MISKEDIIARLQAGSTMDEIVDDITKTINDAQDEYKAIQEKESIDVEAARVENAKQEAVCMIIDGICDYLVAVGDDELLNEMHEMTVGELVKAVDAMYGITKSLKKLERAASLEDLFGMF